MLRASIGFFVIGLLAYAIGAGNLGVLSLDIGRMLLQIFIVLSVISLLFSLLTGRRPKLP